MAAVFRVSTGFIPCCVGAVCVAGIVFAASLFGILTRPDGMLAVLWPANALLTAAFVRGRAMNTPLGWCAAFIAYMAADLLTGNDIYTAIWLTGANLAGVAVGVLLLRRLSVEDRNLRRPQSVQYLCLTGAGAALAAAMAGILIAVLVFSQDPITAFLFWFSTEFANYVVILPFALTVARWSDFSAMITGFFRHFVMNVETLKTCAPAISVLVSLVLVKIIGGPGSIVFPVPALLWCALVYRLQITTLFILLVSHWLMVVLELDFLSNLPVDSDPYYAIMSTRLGIALLSLGPLTVASIDTARSALVDRLDHAANHDFLTGLLSRGAFMKCGSELISRLSGEKGRLTIMGLDVDHFKQINDTHGHAAGDRVLVEVARIIRGNLRGDDLIARLGGEEFGLILPGVAPADALGLAQRIRIAIEQTAVGESETGSIHTTISIGVVHHTLEEPVSLDRLLRDADKAMYAAKAAGRNRVVVHQPPS
ncbi:GGDEF domain-containing protein [Thalassospira xiamenensis]|uniref:GGDEF domain-containing protein n=1 Tax=Thalassospira xiamenensis TaxID=220697 RepID=UPI001FFF5D40|nr:GGDEF domain-containing protein [Thalassospira xiamenensis]MCK2167311.1 diguanylate cyclase [Thalassospira xiamenensis]